MKKLFITLFLIAAMVSVSFAAVRIVDPSTSTVYVDEGFESPYVLELSNQEGTTLTPTEMAAITKIRVYFGNTEYVDSDTCPACFNYSLYASNGRIILTLGSYNWTDGTNTATLFTYSESYPLGRRIGTFSMTASQALSMGSETPLTIDYIEEAELDSFAELINQIGITGTPDGSKFLRDDGTWQTPATGGTDNQTIDALSLDGTTLNISLEDDGEENQTVDLSGLQDGYEANTDSQGFDVSELDGTNLKLSLDDDGEATKEIDLSSLQDGYEANTDAQDLTLTGNTLAISGDPNTDVDLSGYLDDTNTTYSAGTGMALDGTTFNCTVTGEQDTGTNTGDEPDASESVKGIVELATDRENVASKSVQGNDGRLSDNVYYFSNYYSAGSAVQTGADLTTALTAATGGTLIVDGGDSTVYTFGTVVTVPAETTVKSDGAWLKWNMASACGIILSANTTLDGMHLDVSNTSYNTTANTNSYGVYPAGNHVTIKNCRFDSVDSDTYSDIAIRAIRISDNIDIQYLTVKNNLFLGCYWAIARFNSIWNGGGAKPDPMGNMSFSQITGNTFEDSLADVIEINLGQSDVGVFICDNTISKVTSTTTGNGIAIGIAGYDDSDESDPPTETENQRQFEISRNIIIDAEYSGIHVERGANNFLIHSNIITNCGGVAMGGGIGVYFDVYDFQISNNLIKGCSRYGIITYGEGDFNPYNFGITDNTVIDCGSNGTDPAYYLKSDTADGIVKISGNTSINSGHVAYQITTGDSDWHITDNIAQGSGTYSFSVDYSSATNRVAFKNNSSTAPTTGHCVESNDLDSIIIRDNNWGDFDFNNKYILSDAILLLPLSDSGKDISNQKNNLTPNAAPVAGTDRFGDTLGAMDFEAGSSQYMFIPSEGVTGFSSLSAITVNAWVIPESLAASTIIGKWSADGRQFNLTMNSSGDVFFYCSVDGTNNSYTCIATTDRLQAGVLSFITGVYDGSYLTIYVNGVQSGTPTALTGTLYNTTADIRVASWSGFFDGIIDDISIFPSALSVDKIKYLYGLGPNFTNEYKETFESLIDKSTLTLTTSGFTAEFKGSINIYYISIASISDNEVATLPIAYGSGMVIGFFIRDGHGTYDLRVDPNGSDLIVGTSNAGDYIGADGIGDLVMLMDVAENRWIKLSQIGTWTEE